MDKLWISCAQNGDNFDLRARKAHFPHVFHRVIHKNHLWISLSYCARGRNFRAKSRVDVWSHPPGRGQAAAETSAIRVPIFPRGSGHSRQGAATAKPPRSQVSCQKQRSSLVTQQGTRRTGGRRARNRRANGLPAALDFGRGSCSVVRGDPQESSVAHAAPWRKRRGGPRTNAARPGRRIRS